MNLVVGGRFWRQIHLLTREDERCEDTVWNHTQVMESANLLCRPRRPRPLVVVHKESVASRLDLALQLTLN